MKRRSHLKTRRILTALCAAACLTAGETVLTAAAAPNAAGAVRDRKSVV